MSAKIQILDAALHLFTEQGFGATTVSAIRQEAQVSNGSFFHAFSSKDELGAELYLRTLISYHSTMIAPLSHPIEAKEGIELMIRAHLSWVVEEKAQAKFLFDQTQSSWLKPIRDRQQEANDRLQRTVSEWIKPLAKSGELVPMPVSLFMAQLIGPAQIMCRAWLSGRSRSDPHNNVDLLVTAAQRALVLDSAT